MKSIRFFVCSSIGFAAVLWSFAFFSLANVSAADSSRSSGFLNAVGGFLNRPQTQTNATNSTNRLRVLDSFLTQTTGTNNAGTNTAVLADRLGAFLGSQSSGPTNATATTNLVQKMRDWLQTQQSTGTNSTSTNAAAQRSWMALTNLIAAHASTNSAATNTLTGTNLLQKMRDWVSAEQQNQTNATNNASVALNSLAGLLNSATNQTGTNLPAPAQTNVAPARPLFRGLGSLLDRESTSKRGHQ